MSPGIRKLIGSLKGSTCTYLMRYNLWDKYCVRSQEMNVLAVLDDNIRKIAEVSALIVIVNSWNWKMRNNFTPNPSLKKIVVMIKLGIIVSWSFMPILCTMHTGQRHSNFQEGCSALNCTSPWEIESYFFYVYLRYCPKLSLLCL